MSRDIEQAAIVRLAMHFEQSGTDISQQGDTDWFVIHKGSRTAIGRQRPPQNDLGFPGNRLGGQQGVCRIVFRGLENRGGGSLRRAGPN
jgi:hypothetical protein